MGTQADLAVVLTILADGGFVLRCRATAGNMERYLEGAEAVEFLFWGLRQLVSAEVDFPG